MSIFGGGNLKMIRPSYLYLLILILGYSNAHCQEWKSFYMTALNAYQSNDFGNAANQAENALSTYLREDGKPSDNYASILRLLQNVTYSVGDSEKALVYADKELEVRQANKDQFYAGALVQRGTFLQALGRYAEAKDSYQTAYDILSQFFPLTSPDVIDARVGVGINAYLSDDSKTAEKVFKEVFSLDVQEVSGLYVQGRYYFGLLLIDASDFKSALESLLVVKDVYEAQDYKSTTEYASLLTNIGLCYNKLADNNKAEEVYAEASSIFQVLKATGSEYNTLLNYRAINLDALGRHEESQKLLAGLSASSDPSVAAVYLSNKAAGVANNGEYTQAVELYKQALAKLDKTNADYRELYVSILQNLAIAYDDQGLLAEADAALIEAESLTKNKLHWASIQVNRANLLVKQGKLSSAQITYNDALSLIPADSKERPRILSGLGSIAYKRGEIQHADSLYSFLLDQYDAGIFTKDKTYAAALNNHAAVKQTNGEYFAARKLLEQAAAFTKSDLGVTNVSYARALENLGYINLDIGSLTSAKTMIDSAVLLYEQLLGNTSLAYGSALLNQGVYHQHAGEYAEAEPALKKAFKIISDHKQASASDWIRGANAVALFYQTMGNYEQAESLFKQIRKKSEAALGNTSVEYSTALQNLATLYQLQDKLQDAEPLLEEALIIDKKNYGDNHPTYIVALRNLSAVYQKSGKIENAKTLLEQALNATEATFGQNHPSYASTLSNLAALYQDENNMEAAEKAWVQSVNIRKNVLGNEHPDYARSLYGLASVYFAQGKLEEANTNFKLVVDQYLKQIHEYFPSLSEKEKGAFYMKIKPVFDTYQDFCIQYYKKNPAATFVLKDLYNIQLSTKAILLNSSNKVRQLILSSGDPQLVDRFRQWLAVKESIVHFYSLSAEERSQYEDIDVLRQKSNDLEKELSLSSSLFKSQFAENEINSTRIASLLQPDEAASEILRIQKKFVKDSIYYVALTLKNNSDIPSLVIWPHGKNLENRMFRYHRNAIKYHYHDTLSYNRYWEPISKELADVRKLYLSADGIFNKINFNILENPENNHAVIDDFTIHLVSNTKEIIEQSERKASPYTTINLYGYADFHFKLASNEGDPASSLQHHMASTGLTRAFGFDDEIPVLPGTKKEVTFIQDLFTQKSFEVKSFTGADASEANIKKTPNVKVLHIATHGFFMNDVNITDTDGDADAGDFFSNPLLRSGILLSGAGVEKNDPALMGEDGILTAYEAMNINLNQTDLVVLSACETALGELKNGEGVYGLQRSLIVAGAGAVMMSLWQVDDTATQELMVNFYQLWLNGETKHEAFRKAQLMIKEKYKSPFYWGAFILVGH